MNLCQVMNDIKSFFQKFIYKYSNFLTPQFQFINILNNFLQMHPMQLIHSKFQLTHPKTKNIIVLQHTPSSSTTYSTFISNQTQPIKLEFEKNLIKNDSSQSINHKNSESHIQMVQIIQRDQLQNKQEVNSFKNIVIASFWRITQQIKHLNERIQNLESRIEEKSQKSQNTIQELKTKRYRRKFEEIVKKYDCEAEGCNKTYGSDISLKLHIKLKHNIYDKNQNKLVKQSCFLRK